MMPIYLIGSRARYSEEIQQLLADSGHVAGILVDNLLGNEWAKLTDFMPSLNEESQTGFFLLCPSPPGLRAKLATDLAATPLLPASALIHPSSSVAASSIIGAGSTVNRLVSVGVGVNLGQHDQINRSVSIGHDCHFECFVTVGPGAVIASSVNIEKGVFVGAGAVILPKLSIGANAVVGAGAVVTKDVPPFATVIGNPAAVTKLSQSGYQGFTV
jgi:sugar O-acyltransferase (sialic acid O-acetyltransferase NeuD family)